MALLSSGRAGLTVTARGILDRNAYENDHILVRVTNPGRDPVQINDILYRVPHDTLWRIVELSIASSLDDGPKLPVVIDAKGSISWRVRLEALQRSLCEAGGQDSRTSTRGRNVPGLAGLRSSRSYAARARHLIKEFRKKPWRWPSGIRTAVEELRDRPATIVVCDVRGHRHRAAEVYWDSPA